MTAGDDEVTPTGQREAVDTSKVEETGGSSCNMAARGRAMATGRGEAARG